MEEESSIGEGSYNAETSEKQHQPLGPNGQDWSEHAHGEASTREETGENAMRAFPHESNDAKWSALFKTQTDKSNLPSTRTSIFQREPTTTRTNNQQSDNYGNRVLE